MITRLVKNSLLIGFICLIFAATFGCNNAAELSDDAGRDEPPQTYAPEVIAALEADYYIDYENGTIPIGTLPIGARVVDPSWVWEFRTGDGYTGSGAVKPVTWIIVAKNHYEGLEPHSTLLAEELIGKHVFDNSTNRGHQYDFHGYNHWGESGTANATRGLRPWLNSTGIHAGEGLYQAFSESFKNAVLTTTVPNKEWQTGSIYSTQDRVFLPSTTELGDTVLHSPSDQIGMAYPYFKGASDAKRVARIGGETCWYWTRSPLSGFGNRVRVVDGDGGFYYYTSYFDYADYSGDGVRPALNLKSEILVSEIRIEEPATEEEEVASPDEKDATPTTEEQEDENAKTPVGSDTVTLYYIDYETGTIPIGDLPIGTRVVDPSWAWEFRQGHNYSNNEWDGSLLPPGEVKPIIWIIVAKDHYDLNESHVTLLSEELIGRFFFDYRTDHDHEYSPLGGHWGSNHWGDSGANVNSINGLRPWLNSTGINAKEGFFDQFSVKFMKAVLITPVPNREWKEGKAYTTHDKVFIPSITELGDKVHFNTYQIGSAYPYFADAGNAKRVASLGGKKSSYWTRSPESDPIGLRTVHYTGGAGDGHDAHFGGGAVRPALNLKSGILVSEIRD